MMNLRLIRKILYPISFLDKLLGRSFSQLVYLYQKTISPDHGWRSHGKLVPFCRFHPTCSDYSKQTLKEHGFFKGVFYSANRIRKCHPFREFTVDFPPQKKDKE